MALKTMWKYVHSPLTACAALFHETYGYNSFRSNASPQRLPHAPNGRNTCAAVHSSSLHTRSLESPSSSSSPRDIGQRARSLAHTKPANSNQRPPISIQSVYYTKVRETYKIPFLAPWKKNRTTATCSPAITTINPPSIRLKLKMRFSVLLTVLKLRFSRVRKYF